MINDALNHICNKHKRFVSVSEGSVIKHDVIEVWRFKKQQFKYTFTYCIKITCLMSRCKKPRVVSSKKVTIKPIKLSNVSFKGRMQCQSWLCEVPIFPDFVDNFPEFPYHYFPILCKLDNFILWNHNFHIACIRPVILEDSLRMIHGRNEEKCLLYVFFLLFQYKHLVVSSFHFHSRCLIESWGVGKYCFTLARSSGKERFLP